MARILVVDDEKSIRITLREFLQNEGYDVRISGDALEATDILKEEEFDVVVSDIILPKMNGIELLERVQETSPKVKVIIMTGEPTDDTATEALRKGAFDYLTKPIGKVAALSVVAKAVRFKSLEDENRTYRDRLERLVEERTGELEQSREKYQSIVENIGMGIALISPAMEILEINRQMREWFPKLDPDERPTCYRSFHNPPRETVCDYCPAYKTYQDGQVHETTIVTKQDDGNRQYRIISSPIFNDQREVKAVVEMVENMTEQLAMEAQLRRSQKLESMGTLASGIAHDINNTLAPITLYTDALLENEKNLSKRARRFLSTIKQATGDIESTINRLRMFYKKDETGGLHGAFFDLNDLFHEVRDMTRPRWRDLPQKSGTTVEMKTEIPENAPAFFGIKSEVREALVNLVFNAVDSMPNGGSITLRALISEENVAVEVEDTGAGMNDEQKAKCLEPFYTTKGARGSGLGLPMVFGAVQRHWGKMEIDSEEGQGTTVRLILPLRKSKQEKAVFEEAATNLPALRILCIDDQPAVREALREILEMDGHQVVIAENGSEGISAVKDAMKGTSNFDAVITDLGMPDVDGWEVAEQIKKLVPDIPVFLLSGWGNFINDDEEGMRYVDTILGKPPKISEIRQTFLKKITRGVQRTEAYEE